MTMEADAIPVQDVLNGTKRYDVPSYQRPYKWAVDHAEQLVLDIHDSFISSEQEYYIGSIICLTQDNGRYEIVDGQQRIITLTLILLVLGAEISDARDQLRRMVVQTNALEQNPAPQPSVNVRQSERNFYVNCLINGEELPPKGEKMPPRKIREMTNEQRVFWHNYEKIREVIHTRFSPEPDGNGNIDEEQYLDNVRKFARYVCEKVSIVSVKINNLEAAFRLFNVLNSTGLPLSDADLIKSHLLSCVAQNKENSKIVEGNWLEMETLADEDQLNSFLALHQISEKKDRDRVKQKNFTYYKTRCTDDPMKTSDILLRSARTHRAILRGERGAERTIEFLHRLSSGHAEWMPAFMAFCDCGRYDDERFSEFAELFEKVYMHGVLKDLSKSNREAPCYYVVETINKGGAFDDVIQLLRGFADNDGFAAALDKPNFYDQSRPRVINLTKSIFIRLNREHFDNSAEIVPNLQKITVEHILPQNMSNPYWQNRFSQDQHEEWLHKLGNLTLIGRSRNSAARNYGFDIKKEEYGKLGEQSPFLITRKLCEIPEWDMEALSKRHEELKKELKKLWSVNNTLPI